MEPLPDSAVLMPQFAGNQRKMAVDDALRALGSRNSWRLVIYACIFIAQGMPGSWHVLSIVFTGSIPPHTCNHATHGTRSYSTGVNSSELVLNVSQCSLSVSNGSYEESLACDGWDFDPEYGRTIVSEWHFVCNNRLWPDFSQSLFVFGVIFASITFSLLADLIGRKPVFIGSLLLTSAVGVGTSFAVHQAIFAAGRFITGALWQGFAFTGFLLACELFPIEHRGLAGTMTQLSWAFGMQLLALFAFLARSDWRLLQRIISFPLVIFVAYIWLIPESVPWLLVKNRRREAERILRRAALRGGVNPDKVLEQLSASSEGSSPDSGVKNDRSFGQLLTELLVHRRLRLFIFINMILWFVNSCVYYGLSLSTGTLSGNRFLNFFYSGLVEVLSYAVCIISNYYWGRRISMIVFHSIGGAALIATSALIGFVGSERLATWILICVTMVGKFGITGSFATIFLFTPELFPTGVRGVALGFSSTLGRVGNMVAPFSKSLYALVPWLPALIFGVLSVLGGLLTLCLPETRKRTLPQSSADVDAWYGESKITTQARHHYGNGVTVPGAELIEPASTDTTEL